MNKLVSIIALYSALYFSCGARLRETLPPSVIASSAHTAVFATKKSEFLCSAVAIYPNALLTAAHCAKDSKLISVDGQKVESVKGIEDRFDHTILLVKGKRFTELASFSAVAAKPGQDIYVVGNPGGFTKFFRKGVVAGYEDYDGISEMFLDINGYEGDSGGGVFNPRGELFTIVSAVYIEENFSLLIALPLHFTPAQLQEARNFE